MNRAEESVSITSGCIRTTHARGSFYTKPLDGSHFFMAAAAVPVRVELAVQAFALDHLVRPGITQKGRRRNDA
jgi:hypothetical protein